MDVDLRPATVADEPFLWEMLLHAAHAADEVEGPEALKAMPELARYVEGWGSPGDLGVIAVTADAGSRPVGAAWVRPLTGDRAGYGYVDDAIPELAIAVAPEAVSQGIGGAMLPRLLDDARREFPGVSLSVRADNPARRLYSRLGFVDVDGSDIPNRVGGTSLRMVLRFTGSTGRSAAAE